MTVVTAETSRRYAIDLAERVAKTFLAVFLATYLASGPLSWDLLLDVSAAQRAAASGLVAVVTLIFGLIARYVGSSNTAAWLPAEDDTPRGE
jgi:hypothetical protein